MNGNYEESDKTCSISVNFVGNLRVYFMQTHKIVNNLNKDRS